MNDEAKPMVELTDDQLTKAIQDIEKFKEDRAKLLRDNKGRFLPKTPLEFTWRHFWLEVTEVALAILIAQALWETGVWLTK